MPEFHFPSPSIMGILNITPDSFYDGGKYETSDKISLQVEKLVAEGAHMIDVGAESSRPGSSNISVAEEIDRLTKVIPVLKTFPNICFSIDTWKTQVAEFALSRGFKMINDITGGGADGEMFMIAAKYTVPIVIMHMLGTPETMQNN
ncbi:MAG: dihydropteroate synthase, partial [Fidelibacterota bacterium]